MNKNFDKADVISFVGLLLGGLATVIAGVGQQMKMEREMNKKFNKALAEKNK